MKKTITQWSMVVALLVCSLLNAQEDKGRTGINSKDESVRTTLDVQVSLDNVSGITNEGIILPSLSTTRVAKIVLSKLVGGTIINVKPLTERELKVLRGQEAYQSIGWTQEVYERVRNLDDGAGLYVYDTGSDKWWPLRDKYYGTNGVSVDGIRIGLDVDTKATIDYLNKHRLVPINQINERIGRTKITGTAGTWEKIGDGWRYTGLVYASATSQNGLFSSLPSILSSYTFVLTNANYTAAVNNSHVGVIGTNNVIKVTSYSYVRSVSDQLKSTGIVVERYQCKPLFDQCTFVDYWGGGTAIKISSISPAHHASGLVKPVDQLWYYDE